ncbi:uncharacterized protein LOC134529523 isoform X2 [Bacillus rossius redtenbacheri]|uniref:uncharacterized protein LOC134529523 isoform X2 n=1 Tax=Bacillus rossius redtenbacheri TaxID=93214 RepID=UPI002FDD9D32
MSTWSVARLGHLAHRAWWWLHALWRGLGPRGVLSPPLAPPRKRRNSFSSDEDEEAGDLRRRWCFKRALGAHGACRRKERCLTRYQEHLLRTRRLQESAMGLPNNVMGGELVGNEGVPEGPGEQNLSDLEVLQSQELTVGHSSEGTGSRGYVRLAAGPERETEDHQTTTDQHVLAPKWQQPQGYSWSPGGGHAPRATISPQHSGYEMKVLEAAAGGTGSVEGDRQQQEAVIGDSVQVTRSPGREPEGPEDAAIGDQKGGAAPAPSQSPSMSGGLRNAGSMHFLSPEMGRFRVVRIPGDGSCLFHALCHQLTGADPSSPAAWERAQQLRRYVVRHIRDHLDDYRVQLEDTLAELAPRYGRPDQAGRFPDEAVDRYLRDLGRAGGSWGGLETLQAVAALYQIEVVVHQHMRRPVIVRPLIGRPTRARAHVLYSGVHYDSLVAV